MKTSFIVPGQPIPKGRPRVTRFSTYTPKRTQQFEASIRRAWEDAGAVRFPDGEPLFLCVYARFPIPKRTPKRDAPGMVGTPYLKDHGDIDNIVKAVMDALNGHAYADDAVIYAVSANKLYNEQAFTVVEISTKEGTP